MNISLPDVMKAFVEEQVQSGGYGTVSEYVRDLVRRDQKEWAQDRLEALLLDGLQRGPGAPVTPEFWNGLRREIRERREKRKQSG